MSPKSSAKREAILKTAIMLFTQRGFKSTSMDSIAQCAPVSKATLYKHFQDKKELFEAAVVSYFKDFIGEISHAISKGKDPKNILHQIGLDICHRCYDPQSLQAYRLICAENLHIPDLGPILYRSGIYSVNKLLEQYLTQLTQQKILNVPNVAVASSQFLSLLKGEYYMECLLGTLPIPDSAELEKHVAHCIAIFMRGYAA